MYLDFKVKIPSDSVGIIRKRSKEPCTFTKHISFRIRIHRYKANAQIYIRKLCEECNIPASKYRFGGNSLGTKCTGSSKSMEADYILVPGFLTIYGWELS